MQKETVPQRVFFLVLEWSLAILWIVTLMLIWREAIFYLLYVQFTLGRAARAIYIFSVLGLSVFSVMAMALSGYWLNRRPRGQALTKRWLLGLGWVVLAAVVGYLVVYFNDGTLSIFPDLSLDNY